MQTNRAVLIVPVIGLLAAACGSQGADATTSQAPSCAEITAFADRITDVGIMYDYQPSDSPQDLADDTDVAFAGVLTGGFDEGPSDAAGDESIAYVAFEIEVTEVATGETVATGDVVSVAVDYSPAAVDADEFEQAIAAGAPVVVFANSTNDDRGLVAAIEGLMTACTGEAPIGLRGTIGAWTDIQTLDEVLEFGRSDA
ncbi:hypothetical protein [Phytoactinopolyspora limicola]|uniref:hypothetical protein n=1 Tax=Phytoactinopolyspora limicola TaxID=2715536 RepID=UPI00140D34ED|nr:hypothetical protein [Phytoactinopolyspora limicola]